MVLKIFEFFWAEGTTLKNLTCISVIVWWIFPIVGTRTTAGRVITSFILFRSFTLSRLSSSWLRIFLVTSFFWSSPRFFRFLGTFRTTTTTTTVTITWGRTRWTAISSQVIFFIIFFLFRFFWFLWSGCWRSGSWFFITRSIITELYFRFGFRIYDFGFRV